jgi:hypothetical protein
MSVIQVSRIQQRRGRKNTNYGFPQLASGELGWAIDTQELYIGNGAVSEGAPYVGNSKVITEHDDILQFVALYQFQKNNPVIQTGSIDAEPVKQSLQDRLDNLVSVQLFGVKGNGLDDDTVALQRAIDQLFLNTATKGNISSRVVLYMEPGEYIISDEIRIPPYAHIVGAGFDSTIIVQTGNHAVFRMVDGNSIPGSYTAFSSMNYLERPRNILISNLTLESTFSSIDDPLPDFHPVVYLDNTESTLFDRVKFLGTYDNGNNTGVADHQTGVEIRSTSSIFCSENVLFNYCIFSNTGYGIYSDSDHNNIGIDNCVFYQLYQGIKIGGETTNNFQITTSVTSTISIGEKINVASVEGMVTGMEIEFTAPSSVVSVIETALNGIVVVSSVAGLHVGNTVEFTGTEFGGLLIHTVYYIRAINILSNTITVSLEFDTNTFANTTAAHPNISQLSATVANTFGGIKAHGIKYYIKQIDTVQKFITVSLTSIGPHVAGVVYNLFNGSGNMTLSSVTFNSSGATNTKINNSYFDSIDQEGIYISKGYGNTSSHNKFMLVGNANEGYANATYPIIKFTDENNVSTNDYFERNRKLRDQSKFASIAYIPSIESAGLIYENNSFSQTIDPLYISQPAILIRLPLYSSGKYIIDYVIKKTSAGTGIRSGTITISVFLDIDPGGQGPSYVNLSTANLTDQFDYTGSSTLENITFSSEFQNYKNISGITTPDTLVINLDELVGTITMNYTYRMLSQ